MQDLEDKNAIHDDALIRAGMKMLMEREEELEARSQRGQLLHLRLTSFLMIVGGVFTMLLSEEELLGLGLFLGGTMLYCTTLLMKISSGEHT